MRKIFLSSSSALRKISRDNKENRIRLKGASCETGIYRSASVVPGVGKRLYGGTALRPSKRSSTRARCLEDAAAMATGCAQGRDPEGSLVADIPGFCAGRLRAATLAGESVSGRGARSIKPGAFSGADCYRGLLP